jgi:hypothetical protein
MVKNVEKILPIKMKKYVTKKLDKMFTVVNN